MATEPKQLTGTQKEQILKMLIMQVKLEESGVSSDAQDVHWHNYIAPAESSEENCRTMYETMSTAYIQNYVAARVSDKTAREIQAELNKIHQEITRLSLLKPDQLRPEQPASAIPGYGAAVVLDADIQEEAARIFGILKDENAIFQKYFSPPSPAPSSSTSSLLSPGSGLGSRLSESSSSSSSSSSTSSSLSRLPLPTAADFAKDPFQDNDLAKFSPPSTKAMVFYVLCGVGCYFAMNYGLSSSKKVVDTMGSSAIQGASVLAAFVLFALLCLAHSTLQKMLSNRQDPAATDTAPAVPTPGKRSE